MYNFNWNSQSQASENPTTYTYKDFIPACIKNSTLFSKKKYENFE